MTLTNGVELQYNHALDAGYDLKVNIEQLGNNTESLKNFLNNYLSPNLSFYVGYLPKLYVNGELFGEITNPSDVTRFLGSELCVILPPARVGHPELNSLLCNYPNTELVQTTFDFEPPTLWANLQRHLSTANPDLPAYFNYVGYIYPRSGLGAKHQIAIANNVGVVDALYSNNVRVALENRGRDIHMFTNGARVAQLVIGLIMNNPYNLPPIKEQERALAGFGSSGV